MVKYCPNPVMEKISRPAWWCRLVLAMHLTGLGLIALPLPILADLNAYCQVDQTAAMGKETLRKASFNGDPGAQQPYQNVVRQHADALQRCRSHTWPQRQAVWVRLYPCDLQPGILEAVLDRIVNLGYSEIYVEAFYGGQVLLPQADNPTVWPSVVQTPGYEKRDLLAEAIHKGRERGLRVDAWLFTLNFGYSYALRSDRQAVLALNGQGQSTFTYARSGASSNPDEVFVDPYHPQAQADYARLLGTILRRQPDNVLFDYVRYPRGVGPNSVADSVDDLWIYGQASRDALLKRATNHQGEELIRRYMSRGYLTDGDLEEVGTRYPTEVEPLWQNRTPFPPLAAKQAPLSTAIRRSQLQTELWQLTVNHAVQGVLDFVSLAEAQVQRMGLGSGVVFFAEGNQAIGTAGYDSRLQAWERFPPTATWHPMAYGICGHTDCILESIRRVLALAPGSPRPLVMPAIAGVWGQTIDNRPALETQMEAIHQSLPEITALSHFAYAWQDADFDRVRKFCYLQERRP